MDAAIKALLPDSCNMARDGNDTAFALNTSSLSRREIVALPHHLAPPSKDRLSRQVHKQQTLVLLEDSNANGLATVVENVDWEPATCCFSKDSWILANESLEVKISNAGRITSMIDLRERSVAVPSHFRHALAQLTNFLIPYTGASLFLPVVLEALSCSRTFLLSLMLVSLEKQVACKSDGLILHVFLGDVDVWHLETAEPLEAESVSLHMSGPLRPAVVLEYKYGKSSWKVSTRLPSELYRCSR